MPTVEHDNNMLNASKTTTETPTIPIPDYGSWYYILEAILGFLALSGNSLVVFLITTRRCLQVNPNYYILSLAMADLLLGLTLPTFSILCSHVMSCDWLAFFKFFNLFAEISVVNLCLMTCDRYLAINYPLWYITKMTKRHLIISIAFAWIFPAIYAMLPFFWMYDKNLARVKEINKIYYPTSLFIFEVLPVVTMPLVYIRIFTVVRKHSRQVSKQREQVSYNREARIENGNEKSKRVTAFEEKPPRGTSNDNETKKDNKKHQSLLEREGSSSTLVLGVVILLFVLCWSYDIYVTLCTRVHLCTVRSHNEEGIVNLLIYLNSTANPFVYFLFKKDVRRELKAWLHNIINN